MVQIPQLTYAQVPPVAFAGMLADTGYHDIESALAEVPLDVGLGVIVGATGGPTPSVKLPTQISDLALLKGISQYLAAREPTGNANRYAIGDAVPCVTQGRIWVQVDTTAGSSLADNGPVYLVYTGADAGRFRGDTGAGGVTAVLVPNARCKVGGVAGGVAEIKINLP